MKASFFKITVFILVAATILSGCVRLKDKDEGQGPSGVSVKSYEIQNLTIDEPMYLVNGQILRGPEAAQIKEENQSREIGALTEYELHFDHLNFKEGGVLYTMGQVVRIFANDLDSREGKIISLPENTVAPLLAEGVSGGAIYLQVQHARGVLSVFMVGGKGGSGIKGATGLAGDGRFGVQSMLLGHNLFVHCQIGGPGGQGSPGARGGSSGIADIEISDSNNFDLKLSRQGGLGGTGGDGGDGGFAKGPEIGCARNPNVYGRQGARGPQGDNGIVQDVCVTRGTGKRQCL
jgi:hypothetical protein